MKKVMIFMLLMLTLIGCGSKEDKKEVVVIGTSADYPPFEYLEDGEIKGIDPEIIAAIAEKTGIEFKWQDMTFDSLIPNLQLGKVDMVIAGMTITPEREKSVDFSTPYLDSPITVLAPSEGVIKTMDDLEGKRYGVQLGTTQEQAANAITGSTVTPYTKPTTALLDMKNDKLDGVLVDKAVADKFVENNSGIRIVGSMVADGKAIVFKKGDKELHDKVDGALKELLEDGTIKGIVEKYMK